MRQTPRAHVGSHGYVALGNELSVQSPLAPVEYGYGSLLVSWVRSGGSLR
jgi:hypothetical protein